MKRFIRLSLTSIFISGYAAAQSFEWLQTVDVEYELNPGMISYNTCANPQDGCYLYGIQEHVSFYNESMGMLFLRKIGADGNEIWSRSISGQSCIKGLACGENGNVYISGTVVFDSITHESTDFLDPFLTRLDLDILSGNPEDVLPDEVLIYPNPATDRVFIHHDGEYSEFRLYNNFGQKVLSGQFSENRPEIIVADLPAGIYLINLAGKDQLNAHARVVVK